MRTPPWFGHTRFCIILLFSFTLILGTGCGAKKDSSTGLPGTDTGVPTTLPPWNPGQNPPVGPACNASALTGPTSSLAMTANSALDSDGDGLCDAIEFAPFNDPQNPDANSNGVLDGLDPEQIEKAGDEGDSFWDKASPVLGIYAGLVGLATLNSAFLQGQACFLDSVFTCTIVHFDYESYQLKFGTNGVVRITFSADVEKEYLLLGGVNSGTLGGDPMKTTGVIRAEYNVVVPQAAGTLTQFNVTIPKGGCNDTPDFFGAKISLDGDEHCIDIAALFVEDSLGESISGAPSTNQSSFTGLFRATFNAVGDQATQMQLDSLDSSGAVEVNPGDTFSGGVIYDRIGEAFVTGENLKADWRYSNQQLESLLSQEASIEAALFDGAKHIDECIVSIAFSEADKDACQKAKAACDNATLMENMSPQSKDKCVKLYEKYEQPVPAHLQ